MAIDTNQAFTLYNNTVLRNRVRITAIRSAVAVLSEAGSTTFHLQRASWATRVLDNSEAEARKALIALVATATSLPAAEAITDTQIENALNGLINALAGAYNPVV